MERLTRFVLIMGILCWAAGMAKAETPIRFPATTDSEWEELLGSSPTHVMFIRSMQDWQDYAAGARFVGHPLNGLTTEQLARFRASVWVKNGGVVSMNLGILRDNLSDMDYARVLAAFGLSVHLAEDHKGYQCIGAHNCVVAAAFICMSGC